MAGLCFTKQDVRISLPGLTGSSQVADFLLLEAQGVSAEFPRLRCKLKPRMMPEASVITNAHASGITLFVGFVLGPAGDGQPRSFQVSQLRVGMASLEITLDKSVYARLFNPLIGYLNRQLKAYIFEVLQARLHDPVSDFCKGLNTVLH